MPVYCIQFKITSANVMDNILTLPDTGQTGWHT